VTEKSGNLRNDLKKGILKAVSLRKELPKLRSEAEDKNKLTVHLEMNTVETNTTLKALQSGVGSNCRGDQEVTSVCKRTPRTATGTWLFLLAEQGCITQTLWQTDGKLMCLMIIKCTNCSLNLKIIKVQNTPGPYLHQK